MYKLKSKIVEKTSEISNVLIIKSVFDIKVASMFVGMLFLFTAGAGFSFWQIHLEAPLMMLYFLLLVFFTGAIIVLITLVSVLFGGRKIIEAVEGIMFVRRNIAGMKDEKEFDLNLISEIGKGMISKGPEKVFSGDIVFNYGDEQIALMLVNFEDEADRVISFLQKIKGQ